MLNFLENRKDEARPSITGINRKPQIAFGMSAQSPSQFVKNYSVLNTETFANPHLRYEQLRLSKMSNNQKSRLSGDWTKKINLNLIEEEKVVNQNENHRNRNLYHQAYAQQLNKGHSRFRLTKGEFTSFINNNVKNQSLGPLQGQERTLERAQETKKSIMQQSITNLQKLKSNASLSSTFRTSTIYNEKRQLRKSRQKFHKSINVQLQNRRYSKSPQFSLPKVYKKLSKANQYPKNYKKQRQIEKTFYQDFLNRYFNTIHVQSNNVKNMQ